MAAGHYGLGPVCRAALDAAYLEAERLQEEAHFVNLMRNAFAGARVVHELVMPRPSHCPFQYGRPSSSHTTSANGIRLPFQLTMIVHRLFRCCLFLVVHCTFPGKYPASLSIRSME
jgi:hypothetical protein